MNTRVSERLSSTGADYEWSKFRSTVVPGVESRILVTSEAGEYLFLPPEAHTSLLEGSLDVASSVFEDLLAKQIVQARNSTASSRMAETKLRTKKAFLRDGPTLHIFVVSLRCNHSCGYCQVSRQSVLGTKFDMSASTASAAIDRMFETPSKHLTLEFQGGEPLLAFDRIKNIVEEVERKRELYGRTITYTITSTLHHVTDEILGFFKKYRFQVSTSIDGPRELHNANRPSPNHDSYERTLEGLARTRAVLGKNAVSALTTLTRQSLKSPEAIIDEYVSLGFRSIFLRPLSPFGFARRSERKLGYPMPEFLSFYVRALEYILELNRAGVEIEEAYAAILLTHILTPFASRYVDLRSPTGAGFGVLVYNYDGWVYASDESRMLAEMGDHTFRLGSVHEPLFALMQSPAMDILRQSGVAEELPVCRDCAFLPYCGSDPVHAYATQGDPRGDRLSSDFCTRHMGLFRILFKYLHEADADVMRTFLSWVSKKPRALVSGLGIS